MKQSKFTFVVYFIIILAIIGIFSQLFTNPGGFLKSIFIMLGMAAAFFGILYYFLVKRKGSSSNEMKKYRQAVKQSNAKYKKDTNAFYQKSDTRKKTSHPSGQPRKKVRKRSHLRVIDGNKNKRKNRANY